MEKQKILIGTGEALLTLEDFEKIIYEVLTIEKTYSI